MLDLNHFYYFVQVVEHRGFAAAGRALNLPKSTLNRRVLDLEAALGVTLIQRTPRQFVVTDSGREVYRYAVAMLVEADRAESAIRKRLARPSGVVRFTCSVNMAQSYLPDLLARFLAQHPEIDLFVHATNRTVDLIGEGFDVALRGHHDPLEVSGLEQRILALVPWHLVASPAYLERTGLPEEPRVLADRPALLYGSPPWSTTWVLRSMNGEEVKIAPRPRLVCDNMVELRNAAEAGLGIAAIPEYVSRSPLQDGKLRRVLPGWVAGDGKITLLVPTARWSLPAVRAFTDFLLAEFPKGP